jgi:hypothetical protein
VAPRLTVRLARGVSVLAMFVATTLAHAQTPPPAYRVAADRAGVPATALFSLALQESGMPFNGRLRPWPWTLNIAGEAARYATREQACTGLHQALAAHDAKRVDVGLGQVNVGYHGHRVSEPCQLLDPYRNLAIAATILREQHTPGDDWLIAIGRYHRPAGGDAAARYRLSVQQHHIRAFGTPTVRGVLE